VLVFSHDIPSFGGSKIPNCWKKQLYFRAHLPRLRPQLEKLGTRLTSHCSFYVGCTLWGPGELEQQIQRGIWLAVSTPLDELLATQHDYLKQKLKMQQRRASDAAEVVGGDAKIAYDGNTEVLQSELSIYLNSIIATCSVVQSERVVERGHRQHRRGVQVL